MIISSAVAKCPHCDQTLDIHFLGLSSLLGSPTTVCRRCKRVIQFDRVEWTNMFGVERAWFLGMSFLYVAIVGFLGGYSVEISFDLWFKRPMNQVPHFFGPVFLSGFVLWGTFVVLLQGFRLITSMRRTRRFSAVPPSQGFFNLQTWVQLKCLLLLMVMPLLTWLVGLSR